MKIQTYNDAQIQLVAATVDPLRAIKLACDTAIKYVNIAADQAPRASAKLIEHLWKNGHHPPLEQVHLTFQMEGVSRAFLAQITRQRTAHPMSGSQHYQDYRDYPCTIHKKYIRNTIMTTALKIAYEAYNDLIEQGVPRSEARMVLPQASCVNFLFTIDARNLAYFFQKRLTKRNVAEMRIIAKKMYDLACEYLPELYTHVHADDVTEWEEKLNKNTEVRDD